MFAEVQPPCWDWRRWFVSSREAWAARTAVPGTVNYLEGQVSIDGNQLNTKQIGEAALASDQTLETSSGKAEILLSPGVFVRVGNNSELRMVSPELVNPRVELVRGEAMVEVDQKPKDATIAILERGAEASLLKQGLYRFDSDEGRIGVIDGKVRVTDNGASKAFGKGKEVVLNGGPLKPVSFDRKAQDDLYRWSSVRSGYLAEANAATARNVYLGYAPYSGTGWYWNPYFSAWSWLPGDGFFYSPFGYPFFSPGYVIYAPYRGGFARAPIVRGPVSPGWICPGRICTWRSCPRICGWRYSAWPHSARWLRFRRIPWRRSFRRRSTLSTCYDITPVVGARRLRGAAALRARFGGAMTLPSASTPPAALRVPFLTRGEPAVGCPGTTGCGSSTSSSSPISSGIGAGAGSGTAGGWNSAPRNTIRLWVSSSGSIRTTVLSCA